ncbi:MAG: hypothetical protein ABSB96_09440 [Gaiellaceae bacterium]
MNGETKAERRAALERVRSYYDEELAGLIAHVEEAIDRYRAGEIDVHAVDEVIHRYSKAARKLWSFCWRGGGSHFVWVSQILDHKDSELKLASWWEQAAPRR